MVCIQLELANTLAWDKELGRKLKEIRQAKCITRKKLGGITNISYALLEKLEMGALETISKDKLMLIADSLTVSFSELYPTIEIKL